MDWTERDVKTWKRADKGGVVYVVIPGTSGWRSSGKTKRTAAVDWALIQASGSISADVTFGVYARDFFIPGLCRRVTHIEGAHGKNSRHHWDVLRQLLEDYCLPKWGGVMLAALTPPRLYAWLLDPKLIGVKTGAPLSVATRNKLRVAMKHVLDHAAFEGIIAGGIVSTVPVQTLGTVEPDLFTADEMALLFPDSLEELDRVWGGRRWAAYGLILADTSGPRPSEVLALRWRHWHPAHQAFVCSERVGRTGQVGPLKSSRKERGVKRKALLVSTWTMLILEDWRLKLSPKPDDLIFPAIRFVNRPDQPMTVTTAEHHFVRVMVRAGVTALKPGSSAKPRTQYCLRHGANTRARTLHGDAAAQLLLGHAPGSGMTEHYDHPEDADMITRAKAALGLV